jgi:hypothetical protein
MAGDVIQHIREETEDSYSDDSLFHIKSWGADLSFRELVQRYEDNELIKPELQRHYVWDRTEASRFIDSLLLGLPVPSIFLAQTKDEKLLIVDGYQRIMTVYDYVRGIFSKDERVFRLARSDKINYRWRGRAFSELGEVEQRRIRNTTIHAIIFIQQQPDDDDTSLFQIFERINTSGRTLLSQEIRNCVAQGAFNNLLLELNCNTNWRMLFGLSEPDSRMRDTEFILRFFALSSADFKGDHREKISLKRFLDVYMKKHSSPSEESINAMRNRFNSAIELIYNCFGVSAFHNVSPKEPTRLVTKFSPTIYDSIIIATDYVLSKGSPSLPSDPSDARRRLLLDAEYKSAIGSETMTRDSINTRISKACMHLYSECYE